MHRPIGAGMTMTNIPNQIRNSYALKNNYSANRFFGNVHKYNFSDIVIIGLYISYV